MSDENIDKDLSSLSDEDFMEQAFAGSGESEGEGFEPEEEPKGGFLEDRLDGPAGSEESTPTPSENGENGEGGETEEEAQTEDGGTPPAGSEGSDEGGASETKEGEESSSDEDHTTPKQTESGDPEAGSESDKDGDKNKTPEGENQKPDYKQLYEQLMAPFKANGKEFAPSSPEEATRLMQMGANYTKKMQALKPNLKMMRMLENNGLLNESKLNYLIDLEKKDPKAIQKLMYDGKIDPLEIETSNEPTYEPGNHGVSDQEMAFHEVIQDVSTTTTGKETISHVNSNWDQASKEVIYQEPAVLKVIDEQRANGIYDQISAEIDRQRTLGELTETPFIQAYKQVGDRLHAEGKLVAANGSAQTEQNTTTQQTTQDQVLESRAEPPRKPMSNGDKAKAASPGPTAAKTKPKSFDPINMSDEEIMAIPDPNF